MPKGLFRLRGEPPLVQVQFGPFSRPVSERAYLEAGYQPPLVELPWQADREGDSRESTNPDSSLPPKFQGR